MLLYLLLAHEQLLGLTNLAIRKKNLWKNCLSFCQNILEPRSREVIEVHSN